MNSYTTIPDPDDDERWLIVSGDSVIRILNVSIREDNDDELMNFNYQSEIVEGSALTEEEMNELVKKVLIDSLEYKFGREDYLKKEK